MISCRGRTAPNSNKLMLLGIILLVVSLMCAGVKAQSDSITDFQSDDSAYQSKGGSKGGSSSGGKTGTTTTTGKTGTTTTTTTRYYSSGGGSVFLICIVICCIGCIYCCTCGRAFNNQQGQQDPQYHPAPEGNGCVELKEIDDDCCHGNQVVKHGPPTQLNGYDQTQPYYGNQPGPQYQPQPGPYPGPYQNAYPGPYPGNQYNANPNPYQITVSPPHQGYGDQAFFGQPGGPGTPAHHVQVGGAQLPPGFAEMAASNPVPPQYAPGYVVPQSQIESPTKDASGIAKSGTQPIDNSKQSQMNASVNWSKALDSVKTSKVPGDQIQSNIGESSKQPPFTPNNTTVPKQSNVAESVVISSKMTGSQGAKPDTDKSTIRSVDPQSFAKS